MGDPNPNPVMAITGRDRAILTLNYASRDRTGETSTMCVYVCVCVCM